MMPVAAVVNSTAAATSVSGRSRCGTHQGRGRASAPRPHVSSAASCAHGGDRRAGQDRLNPRSDFEDRLNPRSDFEDLLYPRSDFEEMFAARADAKPRPYVEPERHAIHPPALAPRSKAAVQAWNQREREADARGAQNERVANMYEAMAQRQLRAEKRAAREKADRDETGKALTAKEWAKLSPLQQASVQANADLAAAIQRDFKDQGKHHATLEQIDEYNRQVKDLFGEDGSVGFKGLEFAPNTMAFLNERGLKADDLKGRTLDDFISGDMLTTNETLAQIDKPQEGEALFKVRPDDVAFADLLARGQMQYQEDLAAKLKRGDRLLSDISGRATADAASTAFGARAPEPLKLPDVRPEMLEQIDMYMEALARSDSPLDQALGAINLDLQQRGATPKETEQIFGEMMQRSRQGMTGEGKWFEGIDFPMRSPVEVAQALGAPTLKRRATTAG